MKPKRIFCEFDFDKKSMGVILKDENDENYLMSKECSLYTLFIGLAQHLEGLNFYGTDCINISELQKDEKDTSASADA